MEEVGLDRVVVEPEREQRGGEGHSHVVLRELERLPWEKISVTQHFVLQMKDLCQLDSISAKGHVAEVLRLRDHFEAAMLASASEPCLLLVDMQEFVRRDHTLLLRYFVVLDDLVLFLFEHETLHQRLHEFL